MNSLTRNDVLKFLAGEIPAQSPLRDLILDDLEREPNGFVATTIEEVVNESLDAGEAELNAKYDLILIIASTLEQPLNEDTLVTELEQSQIMKSASLGGVALRNARFASQIERSKMPHASIHPACCLRGHSVRYRRGHQASPSGLIHLVLDGAAAR